MFRCWGRFVWAFGFGHVLEWRFRNMYFGAIMCHHDLPLNPSRQPTPEERLTAPWHLWPGVAALIVMP